MSRTGVGCRVLINGAVLDDGCIDWNDPPPDTVPYGVVATSGLSVVWGRDTTIDQPQASTCSFRVSDDPGGATVLQTIELGATVDVFADADISGGAPTIPAFIDPSFDVEVRGATSNATLIRTQARAESPGGWSASWSAINGDAAASVIMPPGEFQAEGTNPLAWIGILSTRGGETWTINARVWIPPQINVRMRPVAFSGPYASAATVLAYSATAVGGASGGWQTLTLTFAPGLSAAWIGIRFDTSLGVTWGGVPDSETWATILAAGTTWADLGAIYVDHVDVLGPGSATSASVLVFSGRITDLEGLFDPEWDQPAMNVTATDFLGDLGNRYVGGEPWPMELLPVRMARILADASPVGSPPIQVEIATEFQAIPMSWDDVDHASAASLTTEIAESVDGVLWSATHPVVGPYMRLENPADRLALYQLDLAGGLIVIVPVTFAPDDPNAPPSISACEVVRDPVRFVTNVSDVATRASITWMQQTTDPDTGLPTAIEQRIEREDTVLENAVGVRALSVETLLTTAFDATRVGDALLARLDAAWRISGVAVADADIEVPDAAAARMFVLLLNGVTRGGQPLLLTDLPDWSPTGTTAPIYLEGGTYTFIEGGWSLDLTVSRAAGQGQNARWNDIPNDPAWIWNAWNPDITWDDLRGVAGP